MREEELDAGLIPYTISDNSEEKFDPPRQVIEEAPASRVHLVDEVIEHLFVTSHEVDERLYSLVWIFLAHCADDNISQLKFLGSTMNERTHVLPSVPLS